MKAPDPSLLADTKRGGGSATYALANKLYEDAMVAKQNNEKRFIALLWKANPKWHYLDEVTKFKKRLEKFGKEAPNQSVIADGADDDDG